MCRSWSPNKAWPICAGTRPRSVQRSSSTAAPTPISDPALHDYVARARKGAVGQHTPHLLKRGAVLGTQRYVETGSMRPGV